MCVFSQMGGVSLAASRILKLVFLGVPAENDCMVIRGRIHNGVVLFGNEISLPEGMEVTVVVPAAPEAASSSMIEEQRRRIRQVMDEIASFPDENPGDTFSGADHDRILYGNQ